jgi:hypothetical protein
MPSFETNTEAGIIVVKRKKRNSIRKSKNLIEELVIIPKILYKLGN